MSAWCERAGFFSMCYVRRRASTDIDALGVNEPLQLRNYESKYPLRRFVNGIIQLRGIDYSI